MKKAKTQREELTAIITAKIGEALENINDKAFKKVKRSTQNTAKKLAKKFTAAVGKIQKEKDKKSKKKDKKLSKQSRLEAKQANEITDR